MRFEPLQINEKYIPLKQRPYLKINEHISLQ